MAAASAAAPPPALRGALLGNDTGLRLLVADTPPFVLDVDSGTITRVRGPLGLLASPLWVVSVGGRGAVIATDSQLFAVRGADVRVSSLRAGSRAIPVADASAWVQNTLGRNRCTLRQVALTGRVLRGPRAFPCSTWSDPHGGTLGVVVRRSRLVDPHTGRTVFASRKGIVAVVGRHVVVVDRSSRLSLVHVDTKAVRALPPASTFGGVPVSTVDPTGRWAVLEYGNPAWQMSSVQVHDLWLVDGETGDLSQLPGMPAEVGLKATNVAWTDDGRLVLLGENRRGTFVAVWHPKTAEWGLKTVRLPERDGGSDSFAVLR